MPQDPSATPSPPPGAPSPVTSKGTRPTGARPTDASQEEYPVYRHSTLFYWWPVWFFGYIMGIWTLIGGWHMAIVPAHTEAGKATQGEAQIKGKTVDLKDRNILVLPEKAEPLHYGAGDQRELAQPSLNISPRRGMGTLYLVILLVVILITNVQFRGLWSVLVMLVLIMLSILFAVAGMWESILSGVSHLVIHLNAGGYIVLSTGVLILWLITFFFFDRQIYMIFAPGQVRVRLEIGGEETVYDTTGMVVLKQRSDLFRHWILGFGSGDLIVRPVSLNKDIEMPNVLHVGRVVRKIEDMVKEKVILASPNR
ncbi:MAG: hypothetical protein HY040_08715 [Planctomycetes bacterium]|nr:hypothetical protein [Planctomycetota bacterium]